MQKLAVILVIVCAVAAISYLSFSGEILGSSENEKIMISASDWLETGDGQEQFSDCTVQEPIPVYVGNTSEIMYWNIPVKNGDGLYAGLMITAESEFTAPNSVLKFGEPRDYLFFVGRDDAYSQMIESHPEYSAGQIGEPRLAAKNGMIYWMSEVMGDNGKIIEEFYVSTKTF